jgi:hypothetical protein
MYSNKLFQLKKRYHERLIWPKNARVNDAYGVFSTLLDGGFNPKSQSRFRPHPQNGA